MAYVAAIFFTGSRLARCIGWLALWQLFSPVRPWHEDLPLLLLGFAAAEVGYAWVCRRLMKPKDPLS